MKFIESLHGGFVYGTRVRALSSLLAQLIPRDARVLDVGSGDGLVAHLMMTLRPDIRVEGIDVLMRDHPLIPVTKFDGRAIPYPGRSFDVVMFVDVLHHTHEPMVLLREAARVTGKVVIIKDHTLEGLLAGPTLRFMDWVGNARFHVSLPYNYWPRQRWLEAFEALRLIVDPWIADLNLYPWWADWIFGRSLHFVARLTSAS